jgi:hypothetical protein
MGRPHISWRIALNGSKMAMVHRAVNITVVKVPQVN